MADAETTRVLVVTGAASGIGQAAAVMGCERGYRVVAFDRDSDGLAATVERAERVAPGRALAVAGDVTREEDLAACFETAAGLGELSGVVAAAGVLHFKMLHEASVEDLDKVLAVNLLGVALTCKYALRAFLATGTAGAITCVSSPQSIAVAPGGNAAYAASKGGVNALVRALAIDYASSQVRVNAVLPGATETPMMWVDVPESEIEPTRKALGEEIPLGRIGQPEDAAAPALWLLSEEAAYVTGAILACEGGILAKSSISL